MKFEAKVVRNSSGSPCFEVKYNERPYKVKLYKFQENAPDGTVIDCSIVQQANGEVFIRQNLASLLREYYEEGKEYEFQVKHDFTHNGYYELWDERGIPFRVPVPKGMKLLTGSNVKCRLERMDAGGAHLKLVQGETFREVPEKKPAVKAAPERASKTAQRRELDADSIASRVEAEVFGEELPQWDIEELFEMLFVNSDYYDRAVSTELLHLIRRWSAEGCGWPEIDGRLMEMTRGVMYVLEGSDILLGVDDLRRKSLQQRLSVMATNIEGFHKAVEYLATGTYDTHIDRVLASLRASGFIYEAEKQLDMLMRIFSLSPDTMRGRMADIFSIIHARAEDFWRDEPFRKAFIRLLQLYTEQCSRGMEETGAGNDDTVRSLIEALGIQLLLADREKDSDVFDYNLNFASLYRYASALRTSVPANAVRNAFLALMDVTRRPSSLYQWGDTGAHDLMASRLTMSPVGLEGTFEKWYANRQVVMSLNNDGICISRSDVDEKSLRRLDLPGVGVWRNLQIRTPQQIALPSGSNDLTRARTMWNAIENSLFSDDIDVKRPLSNLKRRPGVGDEVYVRVIGRNPDGTFMVEATDEEFEGRGILAMEDVVRYKVPFVEMKHFCDPGGNPYVFMAKVKRVDERGLHFETMENITEYVHDCCKNDSPMICVVKSYNQHGILGVSEQGDPVRFLRRGANEGVPIKNGDIVVGNWWQVPQGDMPFIDGTITEVVENPRPFSTEKAFHKLISDFSGGTVYEEPVESMTVIAGGTAGGEDFLSDSRLRELLSIIERLAASESDYMKAYNHIGLARLLARMGRDDRRREFYEAWMRLIAILHYFAINGEIDDDQLKEFEDNDRSRFDPQSELYRIYLQLKIVSYKGRPQMRDELWARMSDPEEEIRTLAENVMAYNLIGETASMSALGEISDRINNILKVQGRKSTLHSFGAENKTTEFKTSLIFPPNNHMRANPDAQSLEIMKELCALLNAEGGTLYLGVNDFGMGVGIENDLSDKLFGFSEDKYDLFFHRKVCEHLGRDVDAFVDGKFETYGGKRIYVVTVKPYLAAPVKVQGVIYERHGSSKLPFIDPVDIRLFTERRAAERDRKKAEESRLIAQTVKSTGVAAPAPAPAAVKKSGVSKPKEKEKESVREASADAEKIHTRVSRKVCPASFDIDHDHATERYIHFLEDGFMLVPEFYGYGEDGPLLSLPVREDDSSGWLALGYADGTVCRVPMRVMLEKEDYAVGKRYEGAPLVFADIIHDGEALMILSEGRKGSWNARADRLEEVPEVAGIRNAGSRMFNTDQASYIFDILGIEKKLAYQDLFDRTGKDAGKPFRTVKTDRLYHQLVSDGYMK
ncbi:MAG: ATP-binding protein [Muribaculaceae bacterium]|nr:ATP-binding protein [Muribaculaceae bacterium]